DLAKYKIYYSDEAYKILGIKPEEYDNTYESFLKYVHPDDVKKIENLLENPCKDPYKLEFRIIRPDGSIRNIYQLVEFVFDDAGNPYFIYGTIQDITEQKNLQAEIERKQEEINKIQKKYEVLVQESTDVFEIIASDGTIKYISKASETVIGYKPEERLGKKIYDYYQGEELAKISRMVQFVLKDFNNRTKGHVVFKNKTGKNIYLEVYMHNLLHEPAIEGIAINFRDITQKVELGKHMAYMATHDEVTDLPNSVYFRRRLKNQCIQARKNQTKFAVMMLDLDGLKNIKYSLGYDIERKLIIDIVERLKLNLEDDIFLSRFSEDHFAFLISNPRTYDEYKAIAVKFLKLFSQPYKMKNYELDISANIGISIYPDDGQDEANLRKQANIALIRAKKEGKNRFKFYSSDLDIQNYRDFILRSDLHYAIEKGHLKIYYQPIVNLKTNEILAVEVLVRWEHPNWGLISSEEFIALAEETSFIVNIENWVLKEICRNYKQWLKNGLPQIKVFINSPSIQFFESDFVDNIKNIIDEFELDPRFLIIEIAENVLTKNIKKVSADIEKLRVLGIEVALNDFGTAFSSLASLYSFKVDYLKLNSLFIKNAILDERSNTITSFIIRMARELKIKLVAEGIENGEQLLYLKELNCYAGQGNIYTKPLVLEDFEKILAKRECKPRLIKVKKILRKEKRKFFRIKFHQLLEATMTVLTIKGETVNVGNTKVLIENIGPGGLSFISNIRFPVEKYFILQFITRLIGEDIKVYGYPARREKLGDDLFKYGIEFTIDENERTNLTRILNQVQVKMRNNILFAEGDFISTSPYAYFNSYNN
ncbi:MAG TPA: EAL domain-containing protein, partial [Clostridia bacterium]|nr:EAL domain-containing protein [Clostridia bacterium]